MMSRAHPSPQGLPGSPGVVLSWPKAQSISRTPLINENKFIKSLKAASYPDSVHWYTDVDVCYKTSPQGSKVMDVQCWFWACLCTFGSKWGGVFIYKYHIHKSQFKDRPDWFELLFVELHRLLFCRWFGGFACFVSVSIVKHSSSIMSVEPKKTREACFSKLKVSGILPFLWQRWEEKQQVASVLANNCEWPIKRYYKVKSVGLTSRVTSAGFQPYSGQPHLSTPRMIILPVLQVKH